MRWLDVAFWEDGGPFNDWRLPEVEVEVEVEEVRAQGSLRERDDGSVVTKLRGEENQRDKGRMLAHLVHVEASLLVSRLDVDKVKGLKLTSPWRCLRRGALLQVPYIQAPRRSNQIIHELHKREEERPGQGSPTGRARAKMVKATPYKLGKHVGYVNNSATHDGDPPCHAEESRCSPSSHGEANASLPDGSETQDPANQSTDGGQLPFISEGQLPLTLTSNHLTLGDTTIPWGNPLPRNVSAPRSSRTL
ncbi:hypothetical protein Acr_00g0025500 [Actinidia rufa]|uniref:Uncharacterized protein n=1 Tax=Actinidia rufa TaxID=165716 RepID=A0A7J0DDP4_9ERIC|nr:hypothetical protein Acr_00g0025500 [Actinidia rufa]